MKCFGSCVVCIFALLALPAIGSVGCGEDVANPDPCASQVCDDGNECTSNVCSDGSCTHPAVADGTSCDGGNGQCMSGQCEAVSPLCVGKDCSDGNECTLDVCIDGNCTNPAVTDGTSCNSGNGTCESEVCVGGAGDVPAAPSALTVTGTTSSSVSLSWSDNSDNEAGFKVYRSASASGTYDQIYATGADVTSHTDGTGLSASTTYWYKVLAFNADGASVFSEAVSGTTEAAAPLSYTFGGGTLDDLRAASPTLTFTDLTIDGVLKIDSSESTVVFTVANMDINARIEVTHPICFPFPDSPNVTINATGTVEVNKVISLAGHFGDAEPLNSSCNDCRGKDGGDLTISANNIYLNARIDLGGGWSSNEVINNSPLIKAGCDGAIGGNLIVSASNILEVTQAADLDLDGGEGGSAYNFPGGDGVDGTDGTLDWSGASITVDEYWPPSNCSNCIGESNMHDNSAQWLDYETMTIYGRTELNEEFDHRNDPGTWYWDSGGGYIDWLEDIYYIDKKFNGPFRLVLTAANKSADLDLFVINTTFTSILGISNGGSADESITTGSLPAGRYYIAVSYADDGGNHSTDYTLTATR